LESKVAGRSHAELTEMFNRRFGLGFAVKRLRLTLGRLGLSNGRDCRFKPGMVPFNKGKKGYCAAGCEKSWFRPGNSPQTWRPVGTEIVDRHGYVWVKTRNPKTWQPKHRLVWEKAHGKIPEGRIVIFADGNKLNLAQGNLLLVSRSELAVMNRQGLICAHGGLTKAGKALAAVKLAVAARQRGNGKREKAAGRRGGGTHG
jgi:hypothetical protein